MGRYTSVQTYADNNQRQVPVPYEKATGGARAEPNARPNSSSVRTTEVRNVSGSTAGAGSLNFHTYRIERRREMERLQHMDADHERLVADQEFHAQLERNRVAAEERTRVRAEKRKRRKGGRAAQRKRRAGGGGDADGGSSGGEGDDSDEEDGAAGGGGGAAGAGAAGAGAGATDAAADELLRSDGRFAERYAALVARAAASGELAAKAAGAHAAGTVSPDADAATAPGAGAHLRAAADGVATGIPSGSTAAAAAGPPAPTQGGHSGTP